VLKPSLPARLILPLATIKVALGLAAFLAVYENAAPQSVKFPYSFLALLPIAFGATGALLLLGGREDRRALALGGFFLATAASWSDAPLSVLAPGKGYGLLYLAQAVQPPAFLPYFLWAFVRDFPAPSPNRRRFRLLLQTSAWIGAALFAWNLLAFVLQGVPAARVLDLLKPHPSGALYWSIVVFLAAAAFVLLPWKARQTQGPEHRRARVFLEILGLTFGPMFLFLVIYLPVSFFYAPFRNREPLQLHLVTAVLLPALTLPFTVPYAVLVQRVLDVRLVARRALQYLLARSMVTGLVAVPSAALALYVYAGRHEPVTKLFAGPRVPLLIAAVLTGAAALRYRKPLLDAIDRRFFREQFDARHILTLLVERIRSIRDSTSLAELVTREIDLALHLERISMLAHDARSGLLIDPRNRTRRLDASSALTLKLSNESAPLLVDLDNPNSALRKLPEKDRQWLVESGFRLLVPILARDGALLGLLGLGEKKSGLPFLKEDRRLLHTIASSGAWVLELEVEQTLHSHHSVGRGIMEPDDPTPHELPPPPATERAKECPKCGELHPGYTVFCRECSRRLEPAVVPYVLPGKFRFERRVGTGGMGVVYSGFDMALGRRVAIKTLRQAAPDDVLRLRREARTAAAVSHPHLAPVYGLETWQGTPLLVMELLEGGTLAQRVARGTLAPREIVELGIAMAGALAQLHAADILHRDIKPSNIGYTRDGTPKLMDFGIARARLEIDDEEDEGSTEDLELSAEETALWSGKDETGIPQRFNFAGTLSYLSPEAVRRAPPDATFDLWALAIVLYECLLGRKIFVGNRQQVVTRILAGVPDFSQVCPDHEEALGDFFRSALHRSPLRRPPTAEATRERLEAVRARLERAQ
jgi:tRNA A-37 threonylcarbamoyl transferase component Bud32